MLSRCWPCEIIQPPPHVVGAQTNRRDGLPRIRAKMRGLDTFNGRKAADAALALQQQHSLIHAPAQYHVVVQLEQQLFGNGWFQLLVQVTVFVQYGEVFDVIGEVNCSARHSKHSFADVTPCQG